MLKQASLVLALALVFTITCGAQESFAMKPKAIECSAISDLNLNSVKRFEAIYSEIYNKFKAHQFPPKRAALAEAWSERLCGELSKLDEAIMIAEFDMVMTEASADTNPFLDYAQAVIKVENLVNKYIVLLDTLRS
ncbi:MAG: hypothetical protein CL942_00065 [Desulfovibrio sp.]|nr:hypothetical protein [Desulfovibrio sp.]|tara:strand:+ start:647 stop:1054 length:408 start_codon:yes stop_codon:yes gene_type:complete